MQAFEFMLVAWKVAELLLKADSGRDEVRCILHDRAAEASDCYCTAWHDL